MTDKGGSDDDYTESDDEGSDSYIPGGYHRVNSGDKFNDRYEVICKLGWGHFSTVWLTRDMSTETSHSEFVALKIQKSADHYTEAALDEIELLKKVSEVQASHKWTLEVLKARQIGLIPTTGGQTFSGIVTLFDSFNISGVNGIHVAMVFEAMGPNVLSLIKLYDFKGVPLPIVKILVRHVLFGLDFLHRFCHIIHTDLKPEVRGLLYKFSSLERSCLLSERNSYQQIRT